MSYEVENFTEVIARIESKERFKYTHSNGLIVEGITGLFTTEGKNEAYTLYTKSGFAFAAVGTYPLNETKRSIQGVCTHGRWYVSSVFDRLLRTSLKQLRPNMGDYAVLDTPALAHIVDHGLINYLGRNLK